MPHLKAILALVLLNATAAHGGAIAVVQAGSGGEIRLHTPTPLHAGDRVTFQTADGRRSLHCCLSRPATSFARIGDVPEVLNAVDDRPVFSYRLDDSAMIKTTMPYVGMAFVGTATAVHQARDGTSLIVRSAAGPVSGVSCISQEGVHIRGYRGKKLVSDLYLGLGYDVEDPTCGP